MVFSSIPPYLDPSHSNWHQQPNHPSAGNNGVSTQLLPAPHPPPLPPPSPQPHGVGAAGTIRPGSMAERARLANIPMPEGPLKCPRCESTNTKFCYFNNYSLSQPRHFCKTCRRYWTRGGALRSVPVGGGCRRNKRSKGNSSKSPASSTDRTVGGSGSGVSSAGITSSMSSGGSGLGSTSEMLGLMGGHIPSLRLRPPLQYLTTDFVSGDQLGLSYSGIQNPTSLEAAGDSNFPASGVLVGGNGETSLLSGTGGLMRLPHLQVQQFPFFGVSNPTYPFEGSIESPGLVGQVRLKTPTSPVISQFSSVKMEDNNHNNNNNNNQELNLLRTQFLGIQGNDQFSTWNPNSGWTDLSAFSSSAMTNPP